MRQLVLGNPVKDSAAPDFKLVPRTQTTSPYPRFEAMKCANALHVRISAQVQAEKHMCIPDDIRPLAL